MPSKTEKWRPNPGAQEEALQSSAFELLYGGAAGGGKSDFLLIDALNGVENKNYKAILFRKTYPELEKSLILRSHDLYPSKGGRYNEQKHRWTFPSGALVEFSYMENAKDVYKYQSAQYPYIGFDEATHFTEFQIEYMQTRCRTADKNIRKAIRYASNPGNASHSYFKKKFIDNKEPITVYRDPDTGLTKQYIPSKVTDNKVLMDNDPLYIQQLRKIKDPVLRAQLLEGDWKAVDMKGAYYADIITAMEKDGHICKVDHEKFLPVSVWFDLGMDDQMTMIFAQFHFTQKRIFDCYSMNGMGLDHYAEVMKDKGYVYDTIWMPHDAQVRELGTGKSRLEIMKALMPGVDVQITPRLAVGTGREVNEGINAVRMVLPSCYIDAVRCYNLIDALRNYRHEFDEETGVYRPKPKHDWASHYADDTRYFAVTCDQQIAQMQMRGLAATSGNMPSQGHARPGALKR